jgi:hypothetical protein
MVYQWAKQDRTFCIGRLDEIDVAAKDKRAVMGLQDHAWVITTFLEEILDKWWSQISPWDRGGMRDLAVQFNKLIRNGLSVDEINSFFISHFEYAQRRFTGWLQGGTADPPRMGGFDPQLVALYEAKIEQAQMRMRIRMEMGKMPSTPAKAPRREELPTTQNRDKEKPGGKKKLGGKEKQSEGKEKQIPRSYFEELRKMLTKPDGSQLEQVLDSGKRLKCCYKAMYARIEDSEAQGCGVPNCIFSHG